MRVRCPRRTQGSAFDEVMLLQMVRDPAEVSRFVRSTVEHRVPPAKATTRLRTSRAHKRVPVVTDDLSYRDRRRLFVDALGNDGPRDRKLHYRTDGRVR